MRKIVLAWLTALAAVFGVVPAASAAAQSPAAQSPAAQSPATPSLATPSLAAQSPATPSLAAGGITFSLYAFSANQVSCASAGACLGLGLEVNPKTLGSQVTLGWNGKAWRRLALPKPVKETTQVDFNGVSCARGARQPFCLAVGYYAVKSGDFGSIAVAWTGGAVKLLPAPPPPKGATAEDISLDAVSCLSATHCVAVGSDNVTPTGASPLLIETWNGTRWTVRTKALPAANDFPVLNDVSCVTAADCVLAGNLQLGPGGKQAAYAARWNGTSLTRLTVRVPAGVTEPILAAVSCPSTATCVATGLDFSTASGATGLAFVEVLREGTWSPSKISWPRGTKSSTLFGLSCRSATWCVAAGSAGTGAAALFYNGKTWSALHVPAPVKGYTDDFDGISCLSAKNCVALGDIGPVKVNALGPLSGVWNGKTWALKAI